MNIEAQNTSRNLIKNKSKEYNFLDTSPSIKQGKVLFVKPQIIEVSEKYDDIYEIKGEITSGTMFGDMS